MKQQTFIKLCKVIGICLLLSIPLGLGFIIYVDDFNGAIWLRSVGRLMVFVPLMIFLILAILEVISLYRKDRKKFIDNLKKAMPALRYAFIKTFYDIASVISFLLLLCFCFVCISCLFAIQFALLKGGEEFDSIAPIYIEGLEFYFDNITTIVIIFLVLCGTFIWSFTNSIKYVIQEGRKTID